MSVYALDTRDLQTSAWSLLDLWMEAEAPEALVVRFHQPLAVLLIAGDKAHVPVCPGVLAYAAGALDDLLLSLHQCYRLLHRSPELIINSLLSCPCFLKLLSDAACYSTILLYLPISYIPSPQINNTDPSMSILGFIFALLPLVSSQVLPAGPCIPFGVRISYGQYYSLQGASNTTQINVAFNTLGNCTGTAHWGNLQNYTPFNCTTQYLPFEWVTTNPTFATTIYTCPITGINFSQMILYTVSAVDASGDEFIYLNRNLSISLSDWNVLEQINFLVFGDWSYVPLNSGLTFAPISNCLGVLMASNQTMVHGVLFMGDMAYDLASNNGTNYVDMLLMMEPFSSVWPLMATIGNHDQIAPNDTLIFEASFPYPYSASFYYNFTLGQVTFVSFNPDDVCYNDTDSAQVLQNLTQLLNATLQSASTPYVIPFSHFPMFCSFPNVSQCQTNNQSMYPLQALFDKSGKVPLYLSSHVHTYERSFPIQPNGQVDNGEQFVYTWPQSPIYVIEGAAGSADYLVNSTYPLQSFTASQVPNSGFGLLTLTHDGDILYNHLMGSDCSISDTFSIQTGINPSSTGVFPVWLIVLLCIIGVSMIGGVIWFLYRKRATMVKRMTNQDLDTHYKNMQLFPS